MAISESEPVIDVLERTWASTLVATDGVTEPEWGRPSDLPGWTVKDCLSHMVSVEANLLGEPPEVVEVAHLAHVHTPFQEAVEIGVEGLRPLSGAEVRSALRRRRQPSGRAAAGDVDRRDGRPEMVADRRGAVPAVHGGAGLRLLDARAGHPPGPRSAGRSEWPGHRHRDRSFPGGAWASSWARRPPPRTAPGW